jgi:hypothetical protein
MRMIGSTGKLRDDDLAAPIKDLLHGSNVDRKPVVDCIDGDCRHGALQWPGRPGIQGSIAVPARAAK